MGVLGETNSHFKESLVFTPSINHQFFADSSGHFPRGEIMRWARARPEQKEEEEEAEEAMPLLSMGRKLS